MDIDRAHHWPWSMLGSRMREQTDYILYVSRKKMIWYKMVVDRQTIDMRVTICGFEFIPLSKHQLLIDAVVAWRGPHDHHHVRYGEIPRQLIC